MRVLVFIFNYIGMKMKIPRKKKTKVPLIITNAQEKNIIVKINVSIS